MTIIDRIRERNARRAAAAEKLTPFPELSADQWERLALWLERRFPSTAAPLDADDRSRLIHDVRGSVAADILALRPVETLTASAKMGLPKPGIVLPVTT